MNKGLSRKNAIYTPGSHTTRMINYENGHHLLEIEFNTGKLYHYIDVPPSVWKEYKSTVLSKKSSGKFFNARIKPFYDWIEIDNNKKSRPNRAGHQE